MTVRQVMSRRPITVAPKTSFSQVWELLFGKRVNCLPVTTKNNILLGIIAEEDLLDRLYPSYEEVISDPLLASRFEDIEERLTDSAIVRLTAKDIMNRNV